MALKHGLCKKTAHSACKSVLNIYITPLRIRVRITTGRNIYLARMKTLDWRHLPSKERQNHNYHLKRTCWKV